MSTETLAEYQARVGMRNVHEDARIGMLPRLFGAGMMCYEGAVYRFADTLLDGYTGGYWEYWEGISGAFYMTPPAGPDGQLTVTVDSNGFMDRMSPDAAGVVVCLFVCSHLSFDAKGAFQLQLVRQHDLLRDYACEHPEASLIFSAID